TEQLGAVAANESFFAAWVLQEGAVGALVHQQEFAATLLHAGVYAGNQVALDDQVVVVGPPHIDVLLAVVDYDGGVTEAQRNSAGFPPFALPLDGGQHAGGLFGLPDEFEQGDLVQAAAHRRDVDLPSLALPLVAHAITVVPEMTICRAFACDV